VSASFEAKASREVLELSDERGALRCGKEPRDVGLQCRGRLVGQLQHPPTVGGQTHGMGSTVAGVRLTLGVSKSFEIVDEPNHHVSVDAQQVSQVLLGGAVQPCQTIHHREVTGLHPERFEPLGKRQRYVMPNLGKKEHSSTVERLEALLI
jgi:hypothetical protein